MGELEGWVIALNRRSHVPSSDQKSGLELQESLQSERKSRHIFYQPSLTHQFRSSGPYCLRGLWPLLCLSPFSQWARTDWQGAKPTASQCWALPFSADIEAWDSVGRPGAPMHSVAWKCRGVNTAQGCKPLTKKTFLLTLSFLHFPLFPSLLLPWECTLITYLGWILWFLYVKWPNFSTFIWFNQIAHKPLLCLLGNSG